MMLLQGCANNSVEQLNSLKPPSSVAIANPNDYFQSSGIDRASQINRFPVKNINDYVRGMMQRLMINLKGINNGQTIGVTSFVPVDSDLLKGTLLGNQIAEGFMHELHQFGFSVIDFKLTNSLNVNGDGDFAHSRNESKLAPNLVIDFILSGTLTRLEEGYLVNTRIVALEDKMIVASAQGLIPESVVHSIAKSKYFHSISLSQE